LHLQLLRVTHPATEAVAVTGPLDIPTATSRQRPHLGAWTGTSATVRSCVDDEREEIARFGRCTSDCTFLEDGYHL
jgi:hypothetical protein